MTSILIILAAIALQIFLTARKVSPFLSLLFVAILTGLCLGMSPQQLLKAIETGAGSTLGGLALVICLGAALGKILEESGAAERIAGTLVGAFGEKNIQWAVLLTGFLVGLPLYYNAGFIILIPLIFGLARKTGLPLLYIAIPTAASLSTTHGFLPPHPGPVVLVKAFQADMGKTLLYGLLIAVPAVIVAGPFLGKYMKRIPAPGSALFSTATEPKSLPAAFPSFFFALLPVLLIAASVLAARLLPEGFARTTLLFAGDSNIALLVSVLAALWYFGVRRGVDMDTQTRWVNQAISGIAVIVLIITAGGVFKQVLTDSGTGDYISSFSRAWHMPPLLFAWLVAALLRVMIGSATVAGITAAGVVSPLLATTDVSPELLVLSVGAGSVFCSHVNDSAFWMFKEFFGVSMKQTFLSWTVMETTISVMGLVGVLLLDVVV
ncbi:gluconate transporter [Pseudoxanthomonas sangjuensis]|uniref:GntT/GntP/DsdX family permease n=1 Tax=Pseudoxanthomonas sangjuensis TaxID=1503750 RepID=UPI0013917E18|nr:gluconate:H+ symporter [Pseudoxanthomonas sangjuensis]KAF1714319.1 gluconate transporter [Pseudoxanthomonas sangjuensis]